MAQNLNMLPTVDARLLNVVSGAQASGGVTVLGSVQCISNLCNALHIGFGDESQGPPRGVSGMGEFGVAQGHPKVTGILHPLCGRIVLGHKNKGVVQGVGFPDCAHGMALNDVDGC